MWSLGCILYSLFYTRPPFESSNIQSTYKKIIRGDLQFPQRPNVQMTHSAKNFIEQCLRIDPNDRMTVEQAIKHEWLGEGEAVKLKALPYQCTEATFTPELFKGELKNFCNYSMSIADCIQQRREGVFKGQAIKQVELV